MSCGFWFNAFVFTNSFLLSIGYGEKEGRRIGYAWGRVVRNWKKIEFLFI